MSWVILDDGGNHAVESLVLKNLLFSDLKSEILDLITANTTVDGYVSFEALKTMGIKSQFKLSSQNVVFDIRPDLLKSKKIFLSSLAHKRSNVEVIKPGKWSGFLNLRAKETYLDSASLTSNESIVNSARQLESNIRCKSLIFENRVQYDESFDENKYFREKSRFIWDLVKKQSRLIVGDLDPLPTGFQSLENGAGISYTKAYAINPAYFNSAFRRSSLTLLEKSFVEVLVNGQIVDRFYAQPGVLDLLDFPFLNGSNNVEINLVDSFGQRRKFFFDAAFDFRLLPKNLSEYSFNFEWLRDQTELRSDEYDFDQWLATGFYRKGVTKKIALGANYQFRNQYGLIGQEGVWNVRKGLFEWDLASSLNSSIDKNGYAFRSSYQNFFSVGGQRTDVRYNLGVDHFSKDFTFFDSGLGRSDFEWSFNGSVTQNLVSRVSAGLGLSRVLAGSRGLQSRTDLNSTFGFNFGRNFLLSANIKANLSDFNDYSAYFTLNWFEPVHFQQINSSYSPKEKLSSVLYTAQPIRGNGNLRLNAGVDRQVDISRASGSLEYLNQRLDAQVGGATNIADPSGISLQSDTASVSFGTALVFAGGQFAVSRPVDNSFAIVSLDKSLKGKSLPINKFNTFQAAEINSFGPAVLNNLTPYFEQDVLLDSKSLPIGYAISKENYLIEPGFKTGQLIKAELVGEVSVQGRFIVGANSKVYLNAQAINEANQVYNFFSSSTGEFFISGLVPGKYKFILENHSVESTFEITSDSMGIIDLGDIDVRQNSEN